MEISLRPCRSIFIFGTSPSFPATFGAQRETVKRKEGGGSYRQSSGIRIALWVRAVNDLRERERTGDRGSVPRLLECGCAVL